MKKLYILCGLPFSGKSSLAKEISLKTKMPVVSFDAVWQESSVENPNLTYETNLQNCKDKISRHLRNNTSVVFDNLNHSKVCRDELKLIARDNNAEFEVVFLDIPEEEIRARRAKSLLDKTHHVVEDENFDNALKDIERPAESTIIKNDEDKDSFLSSLSV